MKNISILIFEVFVAIAFVLIGLSGKKFLFINGARSAVITLGVIGMLFCTISVGKFIAAAPFHFLSVLGYGVGTVALLAFLSQLFKWSLPYVADPEKALIILAIAFIIKGIIARFGDVLIK